MSVFENGKFYHCEFHLDGRRRRGSTGTANKPQAIKARFQGVAIDREGPAIGLARFLERKRVSPAAYTPLPTW
jgi:hypothetical protein